MRKLVLVIMVSLVLAALFAADLPSRDARSAPIAVLAEGELVELVPGQPYSHIAEDGGIAITLSSDNPNWGPGMGMGISPDTLYNINRVFWVSGRQESEHKINVTVTSSSGNILLYSSLDSDNYNSDTASPNISFLLSKGETGDVGLALRAWGYAVGQTISGNITVSAFLVKPPAEEETIEVPLPIDPVTNLTTATVTAISPGGNVILTVPNGTLALDEEGNPLTSINITTLTELPEEPSAALMAEESVVGEIVDLGPDGATFVPPIQVRFNYTEPLPEGVSEGSLEVRFFNDSTNLWEALHIIERNTVQNYIIADVSHFSIFALVGTARAAPSMPPAPAPGGGPGMGVTSLEPPENIELQVTRDEFLSAEVPTTYRFIIPGPAGYALTVYELEVAANISSGLTGARVEQLKNVSALVTSPPPGIVYKNVNIWVGPTGFATPDNIKEAVIKFRVENAWLTSNNVQARDVCLLRWDAEWKEIETKEITRDPSYTYFEARTNAFSPFAIVAKVPKIAITPLPAPTEVPTVTITPSEKPPAIQAWVYVLIILIVITIGAIYFFVIKKRSK